MTFQVSTNAFSRHTTYQAHQTTVRERVERPIHHVHVRRDTDSIDTSTNTEESVDVGFNSHMNAFETDSATTTRVVDATTTVTNHRHGFTVDDIIQRW